MTSTQPASVVIEAVGKRFGAGPEILTSVTLAAKPGDFIALIGPSGCGKTTLLRLLAGLTLPSAGAVTLDGVIPAKPRASVLYLSGTNLAA